VKYSSLIFCSAFLVALTGCESVRTSVSTTVYERIDPVYQAKVVNVDQRKAYDAVRAALLKLNFTFERGGPAQGKISAVGPMDTTAVGRGPTTFI
jgi:hypothetical protein